MIQVEGINKLLTKISKMSKEIADDADKEIKLAGIRVRNSAVQNVPTDTGRLKTSIHQEHSYLTSTVSTNVKYAPYVEFGTLTQVNVPTELTSYALQFKGRGVGNGSGMRAQPYLFPAYNKEVPELLKRLKKIANERR